MIFSNWTQSKTFPVLDRVQACSPAELGLMQLTSIARLNRNTLVMWPINHQTVHPLRWVACSCMIVLQATLSDGLFAQDTPSSDSVFVQTKSVPGTSLQIELREPSAASSPAVVAVLGLKKLDELKLLTEEQLREQLLVRVQPTNGSTTPPLLGTYEVTKTELLFRSRFPLSQSVRYSVELSAQLADAPKATLSFSPRERPRGAAPKIVTVYPTLNTLPENLLKFYIHFSAPMKRGEAYERIHLMQNGVEVVDPFLELGEELWDVEQTRFTLFIHPGRIKRGVKPREDDGLPMTDGKEYELRIDADWSGADHQTLASAYVKKFQIVAADEEQPNPVNWKIGTPTVNSLEPVTLTFNEPLDHAMLNRVLQVLDPAGELIQGKINIEKGETVWSFVPEQPWKRSEYAIEVATNLEDLVGNSIARPFETKMQLDDSEEISTAPRVAIEFRVE